MAGDEVASGILTQARHAGIRVPEDLFIFGFDFQYIGELLQLPTVNNPISDIGRRAFEILYHHLKEETAEPVKAELKFSFIHRGQKDVRT
nr:substrate-binding domain-containing protein [Paenibacillus larvae]